jgi:hypothetical protein
MEEVEQKRTRGSRWIWVAGIAGVVLFAGGISAGFLLSKRDTPAATTTGSNQELDKKAEQAVIGEVSKIYAVPETEEPVVARIQDKTQIGSDKFFDNAQNGDYVIVYNKARVGIIYRQSEKKIMKIGTVSTEGPPGQAQTAGEGTTQLQSPQKKN